MKYPEYDNKAKRWLQDTVQELRIARRMAVKAGFDQKPYDDRLIALRKLIKSL